MNRYPGRHSNYDNHNNRFDDARHNSRGPDIEPRLRDLLSGIRDLLREAAGRIDDYLGDMPPNVRGFEPHHNNGPRPSGGDPGTRVPLERLREEAREISQEAPNLDPGALRLRIEAVTAETRALQNRAIDPEDRDIAAKILRVLTAVVSEYRPGHVYGLARHHQADWDDLGRRAREALTDGNTIHRDPHAHPADDEVEDEEVDAPRD